MTDTMAPGDRLHFTMDGRAVPCLGSRCSITGATGAHPTAWVREPDAAAEVERLGAFLDWMDGRGIAVVESRRVIELEILEWLAVR